MKLAESSLQKPEKTVEREEIARYEQFLLFPQCFQKTFTTNTKKPKFVWERIKTFFNFSIQDSESSKTSDWLNCNYGIVREMKRKCDISLSSKLPFFKLQP